MMKINAYFYVVGLLSRNEMGLLSLWAGKAGKLPKILTAGWKVGKRRSWKIGWPVGCAT